MQHAILPKTQGWLVVELSKNIRI